MSERVNIIKISELVSIKTGFQNEGFVKDFYYCEDLLILIEKIVLRFSGDPPRNISRREMKTILAWFGRGGNITRNRSLVGRAPVCRTGGRVVQVPSVSFF